jgi:hypothetical protein
MPRAHIPLLQHHRVTRPEQSDVVRDLLWSTTQRCDLEPGVDEIERRRLQLAREEIVLREHDVAEALRVHQPLQVPSSGLPRLERCPCPRTEPALEASKTTEDR